MHVRGTGFISLLKFDQVNYPQAAFKEIAGRIWSTPFLNVRGSVIGNAKVNIKTGFYESGPSTKTVSALRERFSYISSRERADVEAFTGHTNRCKMQPTHVRARQCTSTMAWHMTLSASARLTQDYLGKYHMPENPE